MIPLLPACNIGSNSSASAAIPSLYNACTSLGVLNRITRFPRYLRFTRLKEASILPAAPLSSVITQNFPSSSGNFTRTCRHTASISSPRLSPVSLFFRTPEKNACKSPARFCFSLLLYFEVPHLQEVSLLLYLPDC